MNSPIQPIVVSRLSLSSSVGPLPTTPLGVGARGPDGFLYFPDTFGHRIVVIDDTTGEMIRSFGAKGSELGQFWYPHAVAFTSDPGAPLVVADTWNHRLQHLALDGSSARAIGSIGADLGYFDEPIGLIAGDDDSLCVLDRGNHRLVVCAKDGALSARGGGWTPVTNLQNNALNRLIQTNGRLPSGGFNFPLAFTSKGKSEILVADTGNKMLTTYSFAQGFTQTVLLDDGSRPPRHPDRIAMVAHANRRLCLVGFVNGQGLIIDLERPWLRLPFVLGEAQNGFGVPFDAVLEENEILFTIPNMGSGELLRYSLPAASLDPSQALAITGPPDSSPATVRRWVKAIPDTFGAYCARFPSGMRGETGVRWATLLREQIGETLKEVEAIDEGVSLLVHAYALSEDEARRSADGTFGPTTKSELSSAFFNAEKWVAGHGAPHYTLIHLIANLLILAREGDKGVGEELEKALVIIREVEERGTKRALSSLRSLFETADIVKPVDFMEPLARLAIQIPFHKLWRATAHTAERQDLLRDPAPWEVLVYQLLTPYKTTLLSQPKNLLQIVGEIGEATGHTEVTRNALIIAAHLYPHFRHTYECRLIDTERLTPGNDPERLLDALEGLSRNNPKPFALADIVWRLQNGGRIESAGVALHSVTTTNDPAQEKVFSLLRKRQETLAKSPCAPVATQGDPIPVGDGRQLTYQGSLALHRPGSNEQIHPWITLPLDATTALVADPLAEQVYRLTVGQDGETQTVRFGPKSFSVGSLAKDNEGDILAAWRSDPQVTTAWRPVTLDKEGETLLSESANGETLAIYKDKKTFRYFTSPSGKQNLSITDEAGGAETLLPLPFPVMQMSHNTGGFLWTRSGDEGGVWRLAVGKSEPEQIFPPDGTSVFAGSLDTNGGLILVTDIGLQFLAPDGSPLARVSVARDREGRTFDLGRFANRAAWSFHWVTTQTAGFRGSDLIVSDGKGGALHLFTLR